MGNNQSTLSASRITFGVEIEVILLCQKENMPPDNILHQAVAKTLTDAGLRAELQVPSHNLSLSTRNITPEYSMWNVTWDGSMKYELPTAAAEFFPRGSGNWRQLESLIHGGVEIVSPVFELEAVQGWGAQISRVFSVLRQKAFSMHFNKTTGLHVHVGYDGGEVIPLRILKNIATVIVLFEPVVDALHPGHRGVAIANKFLASNRFNPLLKNLTNQQVFARIQDCASFVELQEVLNYRLPGEDDSRARWYKYNFMSVTRIGTIEFRQHEGTGDRARVRNWVRFCCGLVKGAAAMKDEGVRAVAAMKLGKGELWRVVGNAEVRRFYEG
ncbi:hypothetical protein RUND412_010663 [Rhizina undulata]